MIQGDFTPLEDKLLFTIFAKNWPIIGLKTFGLVDWAAVLKSTKNKTAMTNPPADAVC